MTKKKIGYTRINGKRHVIVEEDGKIYVEETELICE